MEDYLVNLWMNHGPGRKDDIDDICEDTIGDTICQATRDTLSDIALSDIPGPPWCYKKSVGAWYHQILQLYYDDTDIEFFDDMQGEPLEEDEVLKKYEDTHLNLLEQLPGKKAREKYYKPPQEPVPIGPLNIGEVGAVDTTSSATVDNNRDNSNGNYATTTSGKGMKEGIKEGTIARNNDEGMKEGINTTVGKQQDMSTTVGEQEDVDILIVDYDTYQIRTLSSSRAVAESKNHNNEWIPSGYLQWKDFSMANKAENTQAENTFTDTLTTTSSTITPATSSTAIPTSSHILTHATLFDPNMKTEYLWMPLSEVTYKKRGCYVAMDGPDDSICLRMETSIKSVKSGSDITSMSYIIQSISDHIFSYRQDDYLFLLGREDESKNSGFLAKYFSYDNGKWWYHQDTSHLRDNLRDNDFSYRRIVHGMILHIEGRQYHVDLICSSSKTEEFTTTPIATEELPSTGLATSSTGTSSTGEDSNSIICSSISKAFEALKEDEAVVELRERLLEQKLFTGRVLNRNLKKSVVGFNGKSKMKDIHSPDSEYGDLAAKRRKLENDIAAAAESLDGICENIICENITDKVDGNIGIGENKVKSNTTRITCFKFDAKQEAYIERERQERMDMRVAFLQKMKERRKEFWETAELEDRQRVLNEIDGFTNIDGTYAGLDGTMYSKRGIGFTGSVLPSKSMPTVKTGKIMFVKAKNV